MSTKRHVSAGYQDLKRGPNGCFLCRWCGKECPRKRMTFCPQPAECLHEWRIRNQADYAAEQVFKRDRGVCCDCGVDTVHLFRELLKLPYPARARIARDHGIPLHRLEGKRIWDMDHEVEVVRGGGQCGMDNLRTRCIPCHAKKTARLKKELAAERKP